MRKLFTAGCSVSIRNSCETSFPEELSKLLNCELVNFAAGCGSNYRIWRMVTKSIMDGTLTPNDILVIQYTEPLRREFFSNLEKGGPTTLEDEYDDGKLIRYKLDSHTWQTNPDERTFFKLYEENHLNLTYEMENFEVYNYNFQHMLDSHNIKAIFIKTSRIFEDSEWYISDKLKNYVYYDNSNKEDLSLNQTKTDFCHFSDEGHKIMAQRLFQHILNLNLL